MGINDMQIPYKGEFEKMCENALGPQRVKGTILNPIRNKILVLPPTFGNCFLFHFLGELRLGFMSYYISNRDIELLGALILWSLGPPTSNLNKRSNTKLNVIKSHHNKINALISQFGIYHERL